jgi:hypothetical protein
MKKLNVNELKESLLNKEFSFIELDNFMSQNGYYTVMDDGVTSNIKEDLNVVYTALDTQECEVQVSFEITINNGEDEIEESFYLNVLNIEEF